MFMPMLKQIKDGEHQTKDSMSSTLAVHVIFKSLFISKPLAAKQQRKMTHFCLFWRN